jgi:hypothetical protein
VQADITAGDSTWFRRLPCMSLLRRTRPTGDRAVGCVVSRQRTGARSQRQHHQARLADTHRYCKLVSDEMESGMSPVNLFQGRFLRVAQAVTRQPGGAAAVSVLAPGPGGMRPVQISSLRAQPAASTASRARTRTPATSASQARWEAFLHREAKMDCGRAHT